MNLYKRVLALSCCFVLFYLMPCHVKAQIGAGGRSLTTPAEYEAKWKTVDSLTSKAGLTESALAAVNRIYNLAKQEKNDVHVIRALIYRRDLRSQNTQDAADSTIAELQKEVAGARQPVRSVLQNILAFEYWSYFQSNRYRFYNRTNTGGPVNRDIATWTVDDLRKKIEELYLASLKQDKLLQSIKLEGFEPILIKGNSRGLRPTLFDLLAHEALDFLKSGDDGINQASSVFGIDDPAAFSDAGDFARHVFATDDSLSTHYQALHLFQRLIRFHMADPMPDALIDVDIERIDFVYAYAVMDNKQEAYRQAVVRLTGRYGTLSAAAQAWYRLALIYRGKSFEEAPPVENDKDDADSAARSGNIRALAICDKVLEEKDSSEGKVNCANLRREILKPGIQLQTEQVNLPNLPFRSRVNWANFDRLYMRIIRVDSLEKRMPFFQMWDDAFWSKLLSLPVYRSSMQPLPPTSDHRTHSVEIAIASLPAGSYVLLAANNPGWNLTNEVISVQYFSVSSIAFISHARDYFVLNRESGQPLPGATAQVWQEKYNNRTSAREWAKKESYQTDAQGHFLIREKKDENYSAEALDVRLAGDHLFLSNATLPYYYASSVSNDKLLEKEASEKKYAHTFFFLDRSIYRPGQTFNFKGIVITQDADTRKPKVFPDMASTIFLYNVNDEKVDSVEVTTNAFGSYHGTFHLPENTLNGKFHIGEKTTGENKYFSVEEYKRPKFFVEYEKQKGSYRLGDSVLVAGNAKAYAGNAIDGAKVRYRIIRNARFPYYWLFWRGNQPSSAAQEIAHGEVKTGADGKFLLRFVARPDRTIDPASYPEFTYAVTADVTDINGETRSGTTNIIVGTTAMKLSVNISQGDPLPADSFKALSISATNLAGEPVGTSVRIVLYPLQSPNRLIRPRYWEAPDLYILSEKDFLDSFPHDEYRQETKQEGWPRGGKVWDTTAQLSGNQGMHSISAGITFAPGWYLIEASAKDSFGREVKDLRIVELSDTKTGRPPTPQYNWTAQSELTAGPGEKVPVSIGSSAGNVFVIRTVERPEGGIFRKVPYFRGNNEGTAAGNFRFLTIDRDKKTVDWDITEADRGGLGVQDVFVKDNRLYTHSSTIAVPWTNKELRIDYATYRDKTEPGSEEKWKVGISGYRKELASAELLTAMYDASLDQFEPHSWAAPYIYPVYYQHGNWESPGNFQTVSGQERIFDNNTYPQVDKRYDRLLSSTFAIHYKLQRDAVEYRIRGVASGISGFSGVSPLMSKFDGKDYFYGASNKAGERLIENKVVYSWQAQATEGEASASVPFAASAPIQVRKNFNETALFFPDLQTDSAGNVTFSFTMPEALTSWKWMTLAHTRDAAFGYSEKTVITQKKLMVQPNAPRFLREGDRMELSVKVSNLTDSEMTGQMALQLTDPTTGETADGLFLNRQPNQYFTVGAGQSAVVAFPLDVPLNYSRPLTYRVVAQSGNYSDGEEATLPVVSNRMLVTEALPLNMPGDGERHFTFDKLLKSGGSETLNTRSLTVEFTANPAWYAVQALPYLMEYPYECAEQTFNRFYANALATTIVSSSPRLREVFSRWNTRDTAALLSNLQKNAELKSVLLEETPWVLQGKTEEQQKRNIALLFDMSRMSKELLSTLDKLKDMQTSGGGFVWFKGGPEDRYITQYILTGIGHLQQLKALPPPMTAKIKEIVTAGLAYLDGEIRKDYEEELKAAAREAGGKRSAKAAPDGKEQAKTTGAMRGAKTVAGGIGDTKSAPRRIGELPIQYLYMRSLFNDYGIPGNIFPAVNYYRKQARQTWVQYSRYMQGMIALALFRTGDGETGRNIIESLRQNSIRDEEKGMYWGGMEGGYYWYQAPVEIQSLLIEAFHEISGDAGIDRQLKTWLLKQKHTHSWATTKATADACYALLLGGTDWLNAERDIEVKLGDKTIQWSGGAAGGDGGAEAGTGYYKKIFDGPFVNPSMGNIDVTMRTRSGTGSAAGGMAGDGGAGTGNKSVGAGGGGNSGGAKGGVNGGSPAWGAVYWQYFDNLDQITPTRGNKSALRLSKQLFIERNTDKGPVLEPLAENGTLKVGDKVTVRVELKVDRDLEYVHMKDMRAACMEPLDVISGYKWQGGLGYYQSTRDASTDFFFSQLPRGTYMFEYSLSAGQTGNFSNGITTIECMYAPEFSYHSEGIRINVEGMP